MDDSAQNLKFSLRHEPKKWTSLHEKLSYSIL